MSRLETVRFAGPVGRIEGLWKEADGVHCGSAVLGHPHPRHGGTLHNKVVHRASRALTGAGFSTLRFNFRGVGQSEGRYDFGRGETDDFRVAIDEAVRRGGEPVVAGGFSFGSAVALRAIERDPRVAAYLGIGLPLASDSGAGLSRPRIPALFVTGERDAFGPPELVRQFAGGSANVVVVPGADHFFGGRLDLLERAVSDFLVSLPVCAGRR